MIPRIPVDSLLGNTQEHLQRTGRPLVTLSYAQSLDGSLAARRGEPLALSGEESTKLTHRLRAAHQAILVGIGTVLSDDPQLTVRHGKGQNPQPVVLDSRLRFPLEARLLKTAKKPWLFTAVGVNVEAKERLRNAGAEVFEIETNEGGQVRLDKVLGRLGEKGISSLMVEGGAAVITSFLQEGLADVLVLTIAPVYIGGYNAVQTSLSRYAKIKEADVTTVGSDIVLWGRLA
jgi:3,4-dihydroxy 2-butanone 4-phosphate synthase/GTP cyclohydrolase II